MLVCIYIYIHKFTLIYCMFPYIKKRICLPSHIYIIQSAYVLRFIYNISFFFMQENRKGCNF